jgi:acetyl esterase/lipase
MTEDATPVPCAQALAYMRSQMAKPPIWEQDMTDLRRDAHQEIRATTGPPEPVAMVEDLSIGGVRARLYHPALDMRDVLVWFHGGGWMLGDLDCFDPLARALANRSPCAVLAVDYRLAPEHPYPAAIDDAWTATVWASQRFTRIAVGGDSAGGNLAAGVALRARENGITLVLQLLVYPVLAYGVGTSSYEAFRKHYSNFAGQEGFGASAQDGIRFIWDLYVPDLFRRQDQDAAPMRATSLAGVPPALIIEAEHDILRAEGEEYARRLKDAGVAVESHSYAGQIHGFFHMLGIMPDALNAVDKAADGLRRAFSG